MLPEKKQVLIVDDEPNLRKILAAQLSRDGYDVMTAEDGEQGLQMLRDHHIDLVQIPISHALALPSNAIDDRCERRSNTTARHARFRLK